MKYGVFMFPADYAIAPGRLAREVEARGFDSLFFPEHTHIPVSRRSKSASGLELTQEYWRTLDPFVALTAAAAATERLLVGTGICLVVERDPIILAKEVASVDHVSGGRMLFGVGGGWNLEEMQNHGTDPDSRWRLLRERIEAMKAIWTHDEPEYHGEFVKFDRIWQWPKPIQKPHPPIIVGGDGARTLERVVRYGDVWMPVARRPDFSARFAELQSLAAGAGRSRIPVYIFECPPDPKTIRTFAEQDVERVVFKVKPGPADEVLPVLDALAATMRSV
jgi:probable F420-dependent oxidoreductase